MGLVLQWGTSSPSAALKALLTAGNSAPLDAWMLEARSSSMKKKMNQALLRRMVVACPAFDSPAGRMTIQRLILGAIIAEILIGISIAGDFVLVSPPAISPALYPSSSAAPPRGLFNGAGGSS
ncbi:hypothetical protein RB213_001004 [Colletotrichum asianum]